MNETNSNHRVFAGKSPFGTGLFAAEPIRMHEEILIFTGPTIDARKVIAKGKDRGNPLQVDDDRYIDLEPPGVYINHSCFPNAGIRNDVHLVAIMDIPEGQEIFFDYTTSMSRVKWTMVCRCGHETCRGRVGDFSLLPEAVKKRYLFLNIVQRFIAEDPSRW